MHSLRYKSAAHYLTISIPLVKSAFHAVFIWHKDVLTAILCTASSMWIQCTISYSHAWVYSIVMVDIPYSKSTERCRDSTCAAWSPTKSLCLSSEDRAGIPRDSPYSRKRETHPHPPPPTIMAVESTIVQSSTAGKSTQLIVAALSFSLFFTCVVRAGLINFL